MLKVLRDPRVSIVIPLQRDEQLFEATLLSVLENQPADCQILAAHNGTYSDPFQLGDEVTFVTARSSNLVDLVRDAFGATTAPIVHVIGTGMKASTDWLDPAIASFTESDVAAAAATLVSEQTTQIHSTGWCDTPGRYCQPQRAAERDRRTDALNGFFLDACFVRRDLLGELLDAIAPAMNDPVAFSYAAGCLLKRSGWKISTSFDSQIFADPTVLPEDHSDLDRGVCLASIRSRVIPDVPRASFVSMLQSAILGPGSLAEMLGMLRHRGGISAMRRAIDPDCVSTPDEIAAAHAKSTTAANLRAA
ncbi:MAG: hypothetical protein KDB00_06060 [Planctomycetales bacterium]|nr:hypothetical protein [Planctomycetales bacterium]